MDGWNVLVEEEGDKEARQLCEAEGGYPQAVEGEWDDGRWS